MVNVAAINTIMTSMLNKVTYAGTFDFGFETARLGAAFLGFDLKSFFSQLSFGFVIIGSGFSILTGFFAAASAAGSFFSVAVVVVAVPALVIFSESTNLFLMLSLLIAKSPQ